MGQPDLRVGRIRGPVEVGLVASKASRRRALELVVDVAGRALQCGVHAGERKTCHRKMIELGSEPAVHRVARLTRDRKAGVVDDRRLEVLLMAVVAGCRESHELPDSSALVARGAFQSRVRADERKAVLMIFDIVDRNLPALDRMAVLAVGADLAHVNVSVTVSAVRADIREYQRCVAFRAAHVLMHSAQRVLRLVVTEFGQRADRLPACVGMAVLAVGDRGTVRVRHLCARTSTCLRLLHTVRGVRVRGLGTRHFWCRYAHEHRGQHKGERQTDRRPQAPKRTRRVSEWLPPQARPVPGQSASKTPSEKLPWTCLAKGADENHRRNLFQTPNPLDCHVICDPDSGNAKPSPV